MEDINHQDIQHTHLRQIVILINPIIQIINQIIKDIIIIHMGIIIIDLTVEDTGATEVMVAVEDTEAMVVIEETTVL